ncbi:MAG: TIGR02757 family protein [Treponema sp.]|jgi:uncharacterized protein (TIGR02757 family)|nr:TIGR02757 family protein [Treponema sp.]
MKLDKALKLKKELDLWYKKINTVEFIQNDPVKFPHRFFDEGALPEDVEIAAFLTATIAWGRRDLILKSAERMFALLGGSPREFIMRGNFRKLSVFQNLVGFARPHNNRRCIHRTFFEDDLLYFCRGFKRCYDTFGSLENLFASALKKSAGIIRDSPPSLWDGIALFRETVARANGGKYIKHLADPASASACKRLHLALRWLVRKEGPVDLGLWKRVSPLELFIPLDLHVGRTARRLGLLDPARKANDKKAVISLTEKLRALCPEDPVKYDLALFGMGVTLDNPCV